MRALSLSFLFLMSSCGLVVSSCGKNSNQSGVASYFCTPDIKLMDALDGRETFLTIGDSISKGYAPELQKLYSTYQVISNSCNGKNSDNGVRYINIWVGHSEHWSYCTLNHGIWNLLPWNNEYDRPWNVGVDQYVADLEYEINVLNQVCDKIMFITSTALPVNYPWNSDSELIELNIAATAKMKTLGVKVCDLHELSLQLTELHEHPERQDDVHFVQEGYEILAQAIKTCFDNYDD